MNRKERRAGRKGGHSPSAGQSPPAAPGGEAHGPLALHAQGVKAYGAGQLQEAASLIARAIAADGRMASFHYNLAIVLKAQGKLTEAAAAYGHAIALNPDYGDAHNNLGNVWKDLGEKAKARASFEAALRLKPGNADTHYNLGVLYGEAGARAEAARHFQACLDSDPGDSRGARLLLAHLGAGAAPPQAAPAHLLKLYEVRAGFWDGEKTYYGAALAAEALRTHAAQVGLNVLDIGCGTGLAGELVRPLAGRLDGVDLSPAMLEKAKAKGIYDNLALGDFASVMAERAGSYDAVLGAAVLIHFGDLSGIFQAAAACLRKNGLFIFTLFAGNGADFAVASSTRLAQSGCFAHDAAYVRRLAEAQGFSVVSLDEVVHERDQDDRAVAGLLAVLRAP